MMSPELNQRIQPSVIAPGGRVQVSPEGIVYGTDGKCRWVYQVNQWRTPTVLISLLKKLVCPGILLGVVLALFRLDNGMAGILRSLPLILMPPAVGALLALAGTLGHIASSGLTHCVMFTVDESTVRSQRVKGRVSRETVMREITAWVGGQSQPSLRFLPPCECRLSSVRRIRPRPKQDLIVIAGGSGRLPVYAEPAQFELVLEFLTRSCPDAEVVE